jgi:hypothetical protein
VGNYLPLEHGVHIISQTAAGLAYAHGRHDLDGAPLRIVHRDVSPSNILVSYEGQTKIVDFGIARIQDQIREESGMRPGKASYMSPEQVAGQGVDYRSDIFSLGILLYEISLGQRLWRGPADEVMRRIVEEKIAPPTSIKRDYPPALELIVMKALEKRPTDRYQSAEEMRNDLEEFVDEGGLRTGPRRMALYLKQLFAPDVPISDEGLVQARQLADGDAGTQPVVVDESEELNFDRRASFALRVEAAPAAPRQSPSQALPAPQSSPAAVTRDKGTTPVLGPGVAGQASPFAPPATQSGADLEGASRRRRSTDEPLAPPSEAGMTGIPAFASETISTATMSAAVAAGGRASGSNAWLALMLLVLLGIGAMVFVVLK